MESAQALAFSRGNLTGDEFLAICLIDGKNNFTYVESLSKYQIFLAVESAQSLELSERISFGHKFLGHLIDRKTVLLSLNS